jgi:hypothetical protein
MPAPEHNSPMDLRERGFEFQGVCTVGMEKVEYARSEEEARKRIVHTLSGRVLMQRQAPFVVRWYEYSNWWDHFRGTYFPAWALARWPVKKRERTRELDVKVLYPVITIVKHPGRVPGVCTVTVEDWPVFSTRTP